MWVEGGQDLKERREAKGDPVQLVQLVPMKCGPVK